MSSYVSASHLSQLPESFQDAPSTWAWISYSNPSVAVLPGAFNRSAMQAPLEGQIQDKTIAKEWNFLNTTDFIAYDERFFDIIGPKAQVQHIETLAYQTHEAPCYISKTKQYLCDTETETLSKIQTDPPTYNAHGCVVYKDELYVVTDGYGSNETGQLVKIDSTTWKREIVLNNYHGQPFLGFNDLDIDSDGNFWSTDSKSAYGRGLIDFYYPTNPTVYFVNATTMRPRPVHITTGNANGVAVALNQDTILLATAYDASNSGGVLSNPRLLNNPISYFYDGIRASRSGLLFAGAGDGVDVIDPVDGSTLGIIRVGGGENLAVSMTFGKHDLWIVGRGGLWKVSNIAERLDRK
ncbi:hypothetical protein CC79DRAFT_1345291 [Sarocladium strictum]